MPFGSVCLMIVTRPQFEMFVGTGATKSFTSAVNDDDARLFKNVVANVLHVSVPNTPAAVRLIAVSPNVLAGSEGLPVWIGSVTASKLLTAPSESVPFNVMWSPQHGNVFAE